MKKIIVNTPEQRGIVLKIGSGICFAVMFAIIKLLGGTVPLGEVVFFREAVNRKRLFGVGLGLLGLSLMTLPNFSATANSQTLIGVGLALMSAILIAAALLQVRQLSQIGENAAAIAFYFALTSTAMGAVTIFAGWSIPNLSEWILLISTGLFGGFAQILMTLAYKYAEASAMAPYDYLSIVWAVLIGMVLFGEIPGMFFWLAMPIILLGAYVARPKER